MKRQFLIIAIGLIVFTSCEDNVPEPGFEISWEDFGLENRIINSLKIYDNYLYATTDDGFYRRSLNGASNWELLGFNNQETMALLVLEDGKYLVSTWIANDPQSSRLYRTLNNGNSWETFHNNFGGESPEPVMDLAAHPTDPQVIFATGYWVVAKSVNQGNSWEPVYGNWQGFSTGLDLVAVNPKRGGELWAGGQNGIEQGIILKSNNGGESWDEKLEVVPSPSVLKDLAFHPEKPEVVYGGWEGGITKTINSGETWQLVLESDESRFYFGMGTSPNHPERVYAAGWLKNFDDPQPLMLSISEDEGNRWFTYRHPAKSFGGVYEMEVQNKNGNDILYLGLYKGGVMKANIGNR